MTAYDPAAAGKGLDMAEHDHIFEAEDNDLCLICNEIICLDCGRILDYHEDEDGSNESYTHRDGEGCYLHA